MVQSTPCDIVLLPPDELAKKTIALSKQLAEQYKALFQLDQKGPFPHASLYMVQLKVADLEKAQEILARIAASTPQLSLLATDYYQSQGYIDAEYVRTDLLGRLQMAIVESINPIRDGMRERDKARMLEATGKVRENLEMYGYRGIGELFRPHMTIARFAERTPIDISKLPEPTGFNGTFTKLGLFEMGNNGTCIREIATFEFNK